MGLTSPALIVLLAVLAGVLLAGAIVFWPVLAVPGPGRVAARITVVCALDLVVLGLILAIANRSGDFYASWSELFGTEHVSGRVVALGRSPVVAHSVHGRDGELGVTARFPVTVPGQRQTRGGKLLAVTMTGPVSGIGTSGFLYVPQAAASPRGKHLDLPVIVVISDRIRTSAAAFSAKRIASTAALEIAAGQMRPAIIVMLPASIAPGAGRGCLDVPGGPQVGLFFTEDLPQLIRSGFPASASAAQWALFGDGTGGYCALQLALANSAVYSVAAAPPGYYTPPAWPGRARLTRPLRQQENLLFLLRHQPMQPVSVLLTSNSAAATPLLALARSPMRVSITALGNGGWPLAPVLDRISRLLGTQP